MSSAGQCRKRNLASHIQQERSRCSCFEVLPRSSSARSFCVVVVRVNSSTIGVSVSCLVPVSHPCREYLVPVAPMLLMGADGPEEKAPTLGERITVYVLSSRPR